MQKWDFTQDKQDVHRDNVFRIACICDVTVMWIACAQNQTKRVAEIEFIKMIKHWTYQQINFDKFWFYCVLFGNFDHLNNFIFIFYNLQLLRIDNGQNLDHFWTDHFSKISERPKIFLGQICMNYHCVTITIYDVCQHQISKKGIPKYNYKPLNTEFQFLSFNSCIKRFIFLLNNVLNNKSSSLIKNNDIEKINFLSPKIKSQNDLFKKKLLSECDD